MKKTILLLSIILLVFTSCNNDEAATELENMNTNGTVLDRTESDNGISVVKGRSFYNGNKVVKTTNSDGLSVVFTYTGNLITKMKTYKNNILKETEYYEYDANERLISRKVESNTTNFGYKATYVFNSDQTVTVTGYSGDLINQNTLFTNRKVFLENGQVAKIEVYSVENGNNVTNTTTYQYDDKNTPTNSTPGLNKLTTYDLGSYGSSHNITELTYTTSTSTQSNTNRIEYTYNSYNCPITVKIINPSNSNESLLKIKYFYK